MLSRPRVFVPRSLSCLFRYSSIVQKFSLQRYNFISKYSARFSNFLCNRKHCHSKNISNTCRFQNCDYNSHTHIKQMNIQGKDLPFLKCSDSIRFHIHHKCQFLSLSLSFPLFIFCVSLFHCAVYPLVPNSYYSSALARLSLVSYPVFSAISFHILKFFAAKIQLYFKY